MATKTLIFISLDRYLAPEQKFTTSLDSTGLGVKNKINCTDYLHRVLFIILNKIYFYILFKGYWSWNSAAHGSCLDIYHCGT